MENWDLWQSVLLAMRADSLNSAATRLGINPTTLSRKIKRLEANIGQPLFRRTGVSLKPTPLCLSLLPELEQAETRLNTVQAAFSDLPMRPPRKLAISTLAFIANHALAPNLPGLLKGHNLQVELLIQSGNIHLSRREADIAIRLAKPDQSGIYAEKIADIDYLPVAKTGIDPHTLPWAMLDRQYSQLPESRWTAKQPAKGEIIHSASQFETLLQLVKAGSAKALLPKMMIAQQRNLSFLSKSAPVSRPVWLLTHKDDRGIGYIDHAAQWIKQTISV